MLPVRFISRFPVHGFGRGPLFPPLRSAESLLEGLDCRWSGGAIDVREEEARYVIEADLPGFRQENLDVTIEDGVLTFTADRSEETESGGENYHVRERRVGKVSRSLRLPDDVNSDAVSATLKDGVLTLVIDKTESAKPHKIEVTAG